MECINNTATSSPGRRLSFPDLAAELREQIFEQCDLSYAGDYEGPMPPLIIALRPQLAVYLQALAIFYSLSTSSLDYGTNWTFPQAMSSNAISTIQRLRLEPAESNGWIYREEDLRCERVTAGWIREHARHATGIREVALRWDLDRCIDSMYHMPLTFTQWLNALPSAKTLTRVSMAFPYYPRHEDMIKCNELFASIVAHINKKVGAKGKMIGHEREGYGSWRKWMTEAEVWEWKAEQGQVMDWSTVRAKDHDVQYFWEEDMMLVEDEEAFWIDPVPE